MVHVHLPYFPVLISQLPLSFMGSKYLIIEFILCKNFPGGVVISVFASKVVASNIFKDG